MTQTKEIQQIFKKHLKQLEKKHRQAKKEFDFCNSMYVAKNYNNDEEYCDDEVRWQHLADLDNAAENVIKIVKQIQEEISEL